MIVLDASAIVAIVAGEPEGEAMQSMLDAASQIRATSMNLVEAGLALVLRDRHFDQRAYEHWLKVQEIQASDAVDWRVALTAYLTFGRGVHRASLNLGDCFAYALAKGLDAPLLFKGDDFPLTDVRVALQPI